MSSEDFYARAAVLQQEIDEIKDFITQTPASITIDGIPASTFLPHALKNRQSELAFCLARIELLKS